MSSQFIGVVAKLRRAESHVDELQRRLDAMSSQPDPTRVVQTDIDENTKRVVIYLGDLRLPDETLPLVIGDIVHNFRSALDHMVYEIAGGRGKTEFPVFENAHEYRRLNGAAKLGPLESTHSALFETLQPDAGDDALWVLHCLDIIDKHRAVPVTRRIVVKSGLGIGELRDVEILSQKVESATEPGARLAELVVRRRGPSPTLEVNPQTVSDIEFGPRSGVAQGRKVHKVLQAIRREIYENVCPKLSVDLPAELIDRLRAGVPYTPII